MVILNMTAVCMEMKFDYVYCVIICASLDITHISPLLTTEFPVAQLSSVVRALDQAM